MQQSIIEFSPLHLGDDQVTQYEEQGYLILPGVLSADQLHAVADECMAAWTKEKGPFDPNATWLHNALLLDVHHKSPLVRRYYFTGPMVDAAERLIGPNIKGATSQLTFKLRGNVMPFGWHQDNGYGQLEPANALTTLTSLDDADEENGCLWIIPGSHKGGQIDVSDRLTAESKKAGVDLTVEVQNEIGAIPVPMKAGDAVIFHCHTLHRSEGNRSTTRDRRILFLRYADADADAVEVYNQGRPRLGPLLCGKTQFAEVEAFERELRTEILFSRP